MKTHAETLIETAFRGQLYSGAALDVIEGHIWDSVSYGSGAEFSRSSSQLFLNIGPTSRKSYADTSMQLSGQLPAPDAFAIYSVRFTFAQDSHPADIAHIVEHCVWCLWVGQKRYATNVMATMIAEKPTNPIRICEYCQSVYASSAACPGCGARNFRLVGLAGTGVGIGMSFVERYAEPFVIVPQMFFHVDFDIDPFPVRAPLKLWCHLGGYHARGVC